MAIELTCSCTSCGQTVTVTISGRSNDVSCPVCRGLVKTRNIAGYLYILSNSAMPGLFKIGQTTRSVGDRVAELNSATGVPAPFVVEAWFESVDPQSHETELHTILAHCRLPNREFFRVTIEEAIAAACRVTGRDSVGSMGYQAQDTLPPSESANRPSYLSSLNMPAAPQTAGARSDFRRRWRCERCSSVFTSSDGRCERCNRPAALMWR